MKSRIWLGLLLGLLAGHALAAGPNAQIVAPVVASPGCTTPPSCPYVQNASGAPFFTSDTTTQSTLTQLLVAINAGITVNLNGVSTLAAQNTGNASLATIATNSGTQATAANQTTGNGSLSTIATNSATQATAANQATGNTSAATTATNTGSTATNTSSTASNTGAISTATGTTGDTAYAGSGSSSIIAGFKGIYARLAGILSTTNSGLTVVNAVTPFTATAADQAVTGLTLPGKVCITNPQYTLGGGGAVNSTAVNVNYSGGNSTTSPGRQLAPGSIDDCWYVANTTAPHVSVPAGSVQIMVAQ